MAATEAAATEAATALPAAAAGAPRMVWRPPRTLNPKPSAHHPVCCHGITLEATAGCLHTASALSIVFERCSRAIVFAGDAI